MIKLFDGTFLAGSALVLAALAIAAAAVTRDDLPVIGTGVGALLLVAAVGMAGCAVGGIAQAPTLGWTAPTIVLGSVLGILALLIVAAGIFGWTAVFEPIAGFVPGQVSTPSAVRPAIFALGVLIAVKWAIAIGMAVAAE